MEQQQMIIAAAQTSPVSGNTEANINDHLEWIEQASRHNAQLILFPEMSLTGYERERASDLAFTETDPRLAVFKQKAVTHNMIIIAGAPIRIGKGLHIGAFIFLPDGTTAVYTKQFLHTGEEKFFQPGFVCNPLLKCGSENISVAICADITHPLHAENAGKRNTTLYVAGIFYTPGSVTRAYDQLSQYAKAYNMNVLMANYCGSSYQLDGGGQSAYWDHTGKLVAHADDQTPGLLVVNVKRGGQSII